MLKILPLEERIVLDATIIAAIVPHFSSQDAMPDATQHAAPPTVFHGEDPIINERVNIARPSGLIDTFVGFNGSTPQSGVVDWGDGSNSTTTFTNLGNNVWGVIAQGHTYTSSGTFSGTITVTDSLNNQFIDPLTANVAANGILTATALPKPLHNFFVNRPLSFDSNDMALASFTDSELGGRTSDFSATIDWGDSTSSAGVILGSGGTFGGSPERYYIEGNHTYTTTGVKNVTITVTDAGGGNLVIPLSLTVNSITNPVSYAEGVSANRQLATFNLNPFDSLTSIQVTNWGDGTSATNGTASHLGNNVWGVFATHTYATDGVYNGSLEAFNPEGSFFNASFTALVADGNITMSMMSLNPIEGSFLPANTTIATFTDPTNLAASAYTATINWGDSTANTAGTVVKTGTGTYSIQATHQYTDEAPKFISVTVSQNGNDTNVATGTRLTNITDAAIVGSAAVIPRTVYTNEYVSSDQNTLIRIANLTDFSQFDSLIDFKGVINWGSGEGSSMASFVDNGGGGYSIEGNHLYTTPGLKNITITVAQVTGANTVIPVSLFVLDPIVVNEHVPIGPNPGGAMIATITLPDAFSTPTSGTIFWGDNTSSNATSFSNLGNNLWGVFGNHAYVQDGVFNGSFSGLDNNGNLLTTTFHITSEETTLILAVPHTPTFQAGLPFYQQSLANFFVSNPDPGATYSATIQWEGLPIQNATVVSDGNDHYQVYASYDPNSLATQTLNPIITIFQSNEPEVSSQVTATVNFAQNVLMEGTPYSGPVDVMFFGSLGNTFVDWGDETITPATGQVDPNNITQIYIFGGTHTYTQGGDYTIVRFNSVSLVSESIPITVAGYPYTAIGVDPINATAGIPTGPLSVASIDDTEPTSSDTDFTGTINWGDGSPDSPLVFIYVPQLDRIVVAAPTHTFLTTGNLTSTLTITDEDSTQTIVINHFNVASNILAQGTSILAAEGEAFSRPVATFTAISPALTNVSASIDWGDGTITEGSIFFDNQQSQSGSVFGNHAYADNGNYTITVTITDSNLQLTANAVSTAEIESLPIVPLTTPSLSTIEGQALSSVILATFSNPNLLEPDSDFTVQVDWGDGTTLDTTAILSNDGSGNFTVRGSHTYTQLGDYNITITVLDDGVANAPILSSALIAESQVNIIGVPFEGIGPTVPANTVLATFTDANTFEPLSDYSAMIDWGDGTTTAGTIVLNGSSYEISGGHTYADEGSYTATITLLDGGIVNNTTTTSIALNEPALVPNTNNVVLNSNEGQLVSLGTITFTDPGSIDPLAQYSATIAWGDGTTQNLTITFNGTEFTVLGNHTYGIEGTYNGTLTISNVNSTSAVISILATVTDLAPLANAVTVTGNEGQALNNVLVATFTDPGTLEPASNFSATINWGDGTTTAGTIQLNGTSVFEVLGSHTYADEGNRTVTVTITDIGGPSTQVTGNAQIANIPIVPLTTPPLSTIEGQALSSVILATFSNANLLEPASDFTVQVDWGDGTTLDTTAILSNDGSGNFTVRGSHTYTQFGNYNITITVLDDGVANAPILSNALIAESQVNIIGVPFEGTGTTVPANTVLATFTDANTFEPLSDYSAVINWGDGTTTGGTIVLNGSNYEISGGHTYADEGSYTATITLLDGGIVNNTTTTTIALSEPALIPNTNNIVLNSNEGQLVSLGTITFTDPGSIDPLAQYSATIAWGDGTTENLTITFNGTEFTVLGSHTYGIEGTYNGTLTLVNNNSSPTVISLLATVTDLAPVANAVAISTNEGQALNNVLVATFTDPGTQEPASNFSATINWGDGTTTAGTIQNGTGVFQVLGTHTYADEGNRTVTVTINDIGGPSTQVTETAQIANLPIVPLTTPPLSTIEGQALSSVILATFSNPNLLESASDFTVQVDWGDGTTLDTTATLSNDGLGNFTVRGSHTYTQLGDYNITITVLDDGVANAPILSNALIAESQVNIIGVPFEGTGATVPANTVLATFADANTFEPLSDYSAVINWGDGTTTAGTIVLNGSNYEISGGHTYADEGSYTATITLLDGGIVNNTTTANITLNEPVLIPNTNNIVLNSNEGQNVSLGTITFTDPGSLDPLAQYSATIAWGDGATENLTITFNGTEFTVHGSHTYGIEGTYNGTLTLINDNSTPTVISILATVADLAPVANTVTISGVEGQALTNVLVATFTDPGMQEPASNFSATINWGDGSPLDANVSILAIGGGVFNVIAIGHTYTDDGTYSPQITITDIGGPSTQVTDIVDIANAALDSQGINLTAFRNATFTTIVATFTDANPFETASDFSATINWGDNTTSQGTIQANASGGFDVLGTHKYTTTGNKTVTVLINDNDGGSTTATSTVSVISSLTFKDVAKNLNLKEGALFSGSVGTVTDNNPNRNLTVVVDWGDDTTSIGTLQSTNNPNVFNILSTHTYTEDGSYTLTLQATDSNLNLTVVDTSTVTVNDVKVIGTTVTLTGQENSPLNNITIATFTDPGGAETIADYSATINWGDGTTTAGTIVLNPDTLVFSVVGSHTYTDPGTFRVLVTISHDTAADTLVRSKIIIANPSVMATNIGTVSGIEGFNTSVLLANFTDPGGNESLSQYTAKITWGDGKSSVGIIHANANGGYHVIGDHIYAREGNYSINVTILHGNSAAAKVVNTAVIDNAPVTSSTGETIAGIAGKSNQGVIGTFTSEAPDLPAGDFLATINWGDGTATTKGTITKATDGTFTIKGSHKYLVEGMYTVSVSLSDNGETLATILSAAVIYANNSADRPLLDAINSLRSFATDPNLVINGIEQAVEIDVPNINAQDLFLINFDTLTQLNGIEIENVANGIYTAVLNVANGLLDFVDMSGLQNLSFAQNPGTNDLSSISMTGSLQDINLALSKLTYISQATFQNSYNVLTQDSLQITLSGSGCNINQSIRLLVV